MPSRAVISGLALPLDDIDEMIELIDVGQRPVTWTMLANKRMLPMLVLPRVAPQVHIGNRKRCLAPG